jgi:hypothetical protein
MPRWSAVNIRRKTPVSDKVYAAQGNLMVASLQSNSALHDVNPVTEIVGFRKVMYKAVSCSTESWRPHRDPVLQKLTKNRYRPSRADRVKSGSGLSVSAEVIPPTW